MKKIQLKNIKKVHQAQLKARKVNLRLCGHGKKWKINYLFFGLFKLEEMFFQKQKKDLKEWLREVLTMSRIFLIRKKNMIVIINFLLVLQHFIH